MVNSDFQCCCGTKAKNTQVFFVVVVLMICFNGKSHGFISVIFITNDF